MNKLKGEEAKHLQVFPSKTLPQILMKALHHQDMKGLLIAGGLLVLVVAGVAVRSLTHWPTPEELDRHVREGTASRTQLKTLNHVIKDSEGNVLLDCRAGINRLPEGLRNPASCEDL